MIVTSETTVQWHKSNSSISEIGGKDNFGLEGLSESLNIFTYVLNMEN